MMIRSSVLQVLLPLTQQLKALELECCEQQRSTALRCQQVALELQQERSERLSGLREALLGLRQGQEELQMRGQELTEELRSSVGRESVVRQGQVEALERELKELKGLLQQEREQREARNKAFGGFQACFKAVFVEFSGQVAVKCLASELLAEVQAREEMTGGALRGL